MGVANEVRGGEATAYHKVRVQFNSGIDCGDVPAVTQTKWY